MERRTEFFDSNVLIASVVADHPHHVPCEARMRTLARSGRGACASHTLVETYNTLTRRSPNHYALKPTEVVAILEDTAKLYTVVALTAEETLAALERAASHGLAGPIIYDAILLSAARKVAARAIYTNNVRHFRRVAPDLASIIREP